MGAHWLSFRLDSLWRDRPGHKEGNREGTREKKGIKLRNSSIWGQLRKHMSQDHTTVSYIQSAVHEISNVFPDISIHDAQD